ncbi:MAG: tetratricopeptide repeat protein [Chthoniobacter sp.]|nr:tetratricopeptide repeat protein [Chthoniobacter sp.]
MNPQNLRKGLLILAIGLTLLLSAGGGAWFWRGKREAERAARAAWIEACAADADHVLEWAMNLSLDRMLVEWRWATAQREIAAGSHRTVDYLKRDLAEGLDTAVLLARESPPETAPLRWTQAGDLALALLRAAEAEKYYRQASVADEEYHHPLRWADAQAKIATALHVQHRFVDEYPVRQKILLIHGGPDDPKRTEAEIGVALALVGRRHSAAAETILAKVLQEKEKRFGADSLELLGVLDMLGSAESDLHRPDRALEYVRRALALCEKQLSRDDFRTVVQMGYVADGLRNVGRLDEAAKLYRESLEICEKTRGPEDLLTGDTLTSLGGLLNRQEKYAEAQAVLERALEVAEKVLPPDHAGIGADLVALAKAVHSQNRLAEAERLYRAALAILDRGENAGYAETVDCWIELGKLLSELGKYDEAESLLRRAVAAREKAWGPDHAETGVALLRLGDILERSGRHGEAVVAIERGTRLTAGSGQQTAGLLGSATTARQKGNYAEAETLLRRALSIAQGATPPDELTISAIANDLALNLQSVGRMTEAERYYRLALDIDLKLLGPEHARIADHLLNVATLYQLQGRSKEALPLAERALAIFEMSFGKEGPRVATALGDTAVILVGLGRLDEAERLQRRALSIAEKNFGPDSQEAAMRLDYLGEIFQQGHHFHEAEPVLRRLLMLAVKNSKSANALPGMMRDCLTKYTHCLDSLGQNQAAIGERVDRLRRGESVPDL